MDEMLSLLRKALDDAPEVASWSDIEGEPGVIGVEMYRDAVKSDSVEFFIKVEEA